MRIWGAIILTAILNAAVIGDSLSGKIRNWLVAVGFVCGLVYQIHTRGVAGLAVFAGGVVFTLACTVLLFAFGAIGAGDGKLLAAVGGFLGWKAMPTCLFLTFLLGSLWSLGAMIRRRNMKKRFSCLKSYVELCKEKKSWLPYGQSFKEEDAVIQLSPAILFAVLIYLIGGLI